MTNEQPESSDATDGRRPPSKASDPSIDETRDESSSEPTDDRDPERNPEVGSGSREEAEATCSFGGEEDHLIGRSTQRYQMVKELTSGAVRMVPGRTDRTERLDKLVLNKWLGVPIFLFMNI